MAGIETSEGVLSIETAVVDVTSALPYPSPTWRFTDAAGHAHHHAASGEQYPTLVWIRDEYEPPWYCEDCQDEGSWSGHYECRQCHETITPGVTSDTYRRMAPGRTTYLLDGEPITQERATALIEAYNATRGGA